MQIVIDIPEEDYKIMKHNIAVNNPLCPLSQEEMVSKVADGIPLPKVQTDMLAKIRAEIEQEYNRLSATRADETLELGECLGLKMSLKIIDKYKAESEVKK